MYFYVGLILINNILGTDVNVHVTGYSFRVSNFAIFILPSFLSMIISLKRLGANSFISALTPFWKGLTVNQEVRKNVRKRGIHVSIILNAT